MQTGGYGHLLRSHGLALDHVLCFTIVLADGSVLVVHRHGNYANLYWAVLGGGPGSFGVIVDITFKALKGDAYGAAYTFWYGISTG